MGRLRLGFALLALVLLVPLGSLVVRSLEALEREHELRHAAVAIRVFEEAERALSEFLREEEERPASDYLTIPGLLSPLAAEPALPFVLAYFQTQGSGRIDSPMRELPAALRSELERSLASSGDRKYAEDGEARGGRALEQATAASGGDREEQRERVEGAAIQETASAEASPGADEDDYEQAPGTMRVVQNVELLTGREVDAREQKNESKKAARAAEEISTYAALRELGRVAKDVRREEVQKRRKESASSRTNSKLGADSGAPYALDAISEGAAVAERDARSQTAIASASRAPSASAQALEDRALSESLSDLQTMARGDDAAPSSLPAEGVAKARAPARSAEPPLAEAELHRAEAPRSPATSAQGTRAPAAAPPPAPQRLAMPPSRLSGERVAEGRLLLYRTAIVDGSVPVRQGMLVDLGSLASWTEARVLGDSPLAASIGLEFPGWNGRAADSSPPANRFVYEHRFDAPFDALSLRLALAPLRDSGSARTIYWLALLLLLASTLGLYALYRMTAVAVHFAERRSNFAASVSHELKTPLTAIRMYAEMLRDGIVADEAKRAEYYATITSESERLSRLIDNVLEWSKLEKHQREMSLARASVEPALREVVRVLRPHAEAKGFTLALEIEPDLPAARYDPDALQQILFNLVDNALKYAAGADCKRVELSARQEAGGVSIAVRDYGPGVDERQLPLIFDAFYRAEDELTRKTKGTGIGLALVRTLAEAMGGRASARNMREAAAGGSAHAESGFETRVWLQSGVS